MVRVFCSGVFLLLAHPQEDGMKSIERARRGVGVVSKEVASLGWGKLGREEEILSL